MVVVINHVQNLTSDLLTEAEQWMIVARVRGAMPIQRLHQQKNVVFQIYPQRQRLLRRSGFAGDLGAGLRATHLIGATFRSARRGGRTAMAPVTNLHADYYFLEYRITELARGRIVWNDSFQFKRQAVGLTID